MSTYKFTYFNIRGLGETSRYIFAVAGQEYEDIRIDVADWTIFKETTPLGQLPFLEVDGERIPQSMAIHRYLGRKFDLYGESDIEKARVDVVLDILNDLNAQAGKVTYEMDQEIKQRFLKEFTDVQAPRYLAMLEKLLTANQGGDGFFVGSKEGTEEKIVQKISALYEKISIADIAVFNWMHDRLSMYKLVYKEPKLQAHADRVKALPQIDAWLKKRPVTNV